MKYWKIIADNLSKAGWSWGCVSTVDSNGRTTFVADAHRDGRIPFAVRQSKTILERSGRSGGILRRGSQTFKRPLSLPYDTALLF
jgi:hypothetical protein